MTRTNSFDHVVYEYLKEDYPCNMYSLEELKIPLGPKGGKKLYGQNLAALKFTEKKDDLQKSFKDIQRAFGIGPYGEDSRQGQTDVFDEEDKKFVIKLLKDYGTNYAWRRGINKMEKGIEMSFLHLYLSAEEKDKMADTILSSVNGFVAMYNKRDIPERRKIEFRNVLYMRTQYEIINWYSKMQEAIQTPLTPYMEQVEKSVAGVFLDDYAEWLGAVKKLKGMEGVCVL